MSTPSADALAAAIDDLLLTSGPLTRVQLFAALADRGFTVAEADFDEVWLSDDLPLVAELGVFEPEVFVRLDTVLLGRIFTHRLGIEEIADDFLVVGADLDAGLWNDDTHPYDNLDGRPIDQSFDGAEVRIQLPPGRLAEHSPGDLIGIRAAADGYHLMSVPDDLPAFPDEVIDEIVDLFDDEFGFPPVGSVELVHHLLLRFPDLLREPTQPISAVLGDLGFDLEMAQVRPWGEEFANDPAAEMAELAREFHLTPEQATAVMAFEAALDQWLDAPGPGPAVVTEDVASIVVRSLPQLADPLVAVALYAHYVGDDDIAGIVRRWAHATLGSAPRSAKAHLHWLVGRCADLMNDIEAAQASYETAVTFDPHSFLALRDLAARVSERGDATRAVSLLSRAGIGPEDTLFAMVSRYVAEDRHDLGRNDPCWCGSGQKYKRCHAGRTGFSLDQRVDWLYSKVAFWAQDGAGVPMMTELARIRSEHWAQPNAMAIARDDPFVLDTTLFDGGLLAAYLDARGRVLPEDEQLLAAAWLTSQRSLYEIESVLPGTGFVLRDLRTGDRHDVVEHSGSRQLEVGQLISVRLLSGGGPPVIHGGIEPIPDHQRDAVLAVLDLQDSAEPDPRRTMAVLSGRFAPPEIRVIEGDPLVFCTTELLVPAEVGDDFVDGLTRLYGLPGERRGDDGDDEYEDDEYENDEYNRGLKAVVWDRTEPSGIGRRVLGSVQYDCESLEWSLDANTERRLDDLLAEVRGLAPGIECGPVTRIPLPELSGPNRIGSLPPAPADPGRAGNHERGQPPSRPGSLG